MCSQTNFLQVCISQTDLALVPSASGSGRKITAFLERLKPLCTSQYRHRYCLSFSPMPNLDGPEECERRAVGGSIIPQGFSHPLHSQDGRATATGEGRLRHRNAAADTRMRRGQGQGSWQSAVSHSKTVLFQMDSKGGKEYLIVFPSTATSHIAIHCAGDEVSLSIADMNLSRGGNENKREISPTTAVVCLANHYPRNLSAEPAAKPRGVTGDLLVTLWTSIPKVPVQSTL